MSTKTNSFNEKKLELSYVSLFKEEGYNYTNAEKITRNKNSVLFDEDLINYLYSKYSKYNITTSEIEKIITKLKNFPIESLYDSNKHFFNILMDGFNFKRDDENNEDIWINLLDFNNIDNNIFRFVNQFEIEGLETNRIPDGIVFINGIPFVVFEFKSAIKENTTIYNAFEQVTITYGRDIPDLFKFNAFIVISDGVNNKYGTMYTDYEQFTSWNFSKKTDRISEGINSFYTLVNGMFNKDTLLDIIQNFIYFPDNSHQNKIICRYSQYYATNNLKDNIIKHMKPEGDGKGGTYFGSTGSGKSNTMLFLVRKIMKNPLFSNPTIVLINSDVELDSQLSELFENSKKFIGDEYVKRISSRNDLKEKLKDRSSGGIFLTTIQKFSEDTDVLSRRTNIICISDEAHTTQLNLDSKQIITDTGVKISYGFAKYLHDSLPNATYVGFTGTPIDKTLKVFGNIVDIYSMQEAKDDDVIVGIRYLPAKAELRLKGKEVEAIEEYYRQCELEGSNPYQIESSKKAILKLNTLIGDKERLEKIAKNFVELYEERVEENSTVEGKALFVCTDRKIAYNFYKEVVKLRPGWVIEGYVEGLTDLEKKNIKAMPKIKMVMTRNKTDETELYNLLGNKDDRKEASKEFKKPKSNFKIAIIVDMWLTGFNVESLDTMFIDKAIQKHTLIQTISRVNRKYPGKTEGLIVDYIGIKKELDEAIAIYTDNGEQELEDITPAIGAVKTQLSILDEMFYNFNTELYYTGTPIQQLDSLKDAAEFVQNSLKIENKFMGEVKKLKTAYNICSLSDKISKDEKDKIFFYTGVRSIIYKLNKNDAPDTVQMNKRVLQMVEEAIQSDEVKILFEKRGTGQEILSEDNLNRVKLIERPNTRLKVLKGLMEKEFKEYAKVNKTKATIFTDKLNKLVDKYNNLRDEEHIEFIADEILDDYISIYKEWVNEKNSMKKLNISPQEQAFYDILLNIENKYGFSYDDNKRKELACEIKLKVDDISKTVDWYNREDSKANLKVGIILLIKQYNFPSDYTNEIFNEIYEQAKLFRKS